MSSPNKPSSKSSMVAKMRVKPLWKRKLEPNQTHNENFTKPSYKPLLVHNVYSSLENLSPSNPHDYVSSSISTSTNEDAQDLSLFDECLTQNTNSLTTSQDHIDLAPSSINPTNEPQHTNTSPQENHDATNVDSLVDEINQLNDLSGLLAMHLAQNNLPPPLPYNSNLQNTITLDQAMYHVGYCPCCRFTHKEILSLKESIDWLEYLITRPQPTSNLHHDNHTNTTSAPTSPYPIN